MTNSNTEIYIYLQHLIHQILTYKYRTYNDEWLLVEETKELVTYTR